LRSILVKEACNVLCLLAEKLKESFEPFCSLYIGILLKQVVVKIKVISETSDQCIKTLITCCHLKSSKKIVEGCKDAHSGVLRRHCIVYLHLVLQHSDIETLEKAKEDTESVLRTTLADADSEARTQARSCFATFLKLWPVEGERYEISNKVL
jgi:CLIP-associating protein 1/2